MKLTAFQPNGKCHICGLPTKFKVHQKCAEKARANREVRGSSGFGGFSVKQVDEAHHAISKKRYLAGYVPKFCFD